MKQKLIEIAIPTYNRANYLKDLLNNIAENFDKHSDIVDKYRIVVYDNCSSDSTEDICKNFKYELAYIKNPENLGGNYNIYQSYKRAQAKYIWVMGDDDILSSDALKNTLEMIIKHNPKLLVHWNILKPWDFRKIFIMNTYQELIKIFNKHQHRIVEHSLISANVLSAELFDENMNINKMDTYYGQMYALLNNLDKADDKRPIILDCRKGIQTRCDCTRTNYFPKDLFQYHEALTKWTEEKFKTNAIRVKRVVFRVLGIKISLKKVLN